MFKPIVFANAIQGMSIILHTAERMNINLDNENAEYNAVSISQFQSRTLIIWKMIFISI